MYSFLLIPPLSVQLNNNKNEHMQSSPGPPCWIIHCDWIPASEVLLITLSCSSHIQATPLDKEGQILRRGCHTDVKPLPVQMMPTVTTSLTETIRVEPPSCLPGLPMAPPSLTPDTCSDPSPNPDLPSDSDDISISSASSACSPNSPF